MSFVAIDVETANADISTICQIGLAHFNNGLLKEEWKSYVDPEDYFDEMNIFIHGIDESTVEDSPTLPDIADQLFQQLDGHIAVCHTYFDRVAITRACSKYGLRAPACTWLDSARVARRTWEKFAYSGYGLSNVCSTLGYQFNHHDALEDAKAAAHILLAAIDKTGIDLHGWLRRVEQPIDPSRSAYDKFSREGNPEGYLHGEVLVFTGALDIPRREAADMAVRAGCNVADGVTKNTTILVVGDQDVKRLAGHEKSSKHRKAESLILQGQPIRILMESDFRVLVNSIELSEGKNKQSDDTHNITRVPARTEPFLEDNLITQCDSRHSGIFHASGGIAIELSIDNLFGSEDHINNFTTELKNVDNITLSRCKVGDDVILMRERKIDKPDYVSVTNKNGEYIGDLYSTDASHHYLAYDIDHGSEVSAIIHEIIIKNNKPQCFIKISKSEVNWDEIDKFNAKQKKISELIHKANQLEKTDCEQAVQAYREATKMLIQMDRECDKYPMTWRTERIPIYRLSLILEKQKKYKECLEEIESYQAYDDKVWLYAGEKEKLEKRKIKILK